MAARRTSARLSGGSTDGAEMAGVLGRNGAKLVNGRKRSWGREDDLATNGDVEKKKRKKEVKKQPAFKPQPVPILNSSDTPPDDLPVDLPPPPSERKIARRRESTRAIRERAQDESPLMRLKRQKMAATNTTTKSMPSRSQRTERDDLLADISSDPSSTRPPPQVDFLNFSVSQRPRPSAPRPASPPRQPFSSSSTSGRPSMGPPTGPFVRKTRKSMRGMEDLMSEAVVPVPDSETPMIRKNKELREAQRRSSLGMRGQRASSSLGRGEISIPHPSVDSSTFYKHITPTLPEPLRARHLLVFCAKRALDAAIATPPLNRAKGKEKSKDEVRTQEGDRLVKEIMEEFLANLGKGGIDTNVFAPGGVVSSGLPMRSHPRNVSSREVESSAEAVVKRCKQEDAQWSSLIKRANAKQAEVIGRLHRKKATNSEPDFTRAESWMPDAMGIANQLIAEGDGDLSVMGEFADVQYKVDTLLQTSHAALQYSLQAQRFLDGFFSSLTADLRSRERLGLPSVLPGNDSDSPDAIALLSSARAGPSSSATSMSRDPMHMLRALAAAEAKQQSEETVAAAAMVAPVTAMTPRRPAPGMTPRRAGVLGMGATPRRGV